jgi:hypothetical protein
VSGEVRNLFGLDRAIYLSLTVRADKGRNPRYEGVIYVRLSIRTAPDVLVISLRYFHTPTHVDRSESPSTARREQRDH